MRLGTIMMALALVGLAGCIGGERRLVDRTEQGLDADGLDGLVLDVGAGALEVVGDPTVERVEVTVELATNLYGIGDDEAARDALGVRLEPAGEDATLVVQLDGAPDGYYADVFVRLPARMTVAGIDGSGDTSVSDVAGLDLEDGSGELVIARVAGPIHLIDDSGDILAEAIDGDVRVEDGSGDLRLTDVHGEVAIEDGSGDIDVGAVTGDVVVDDDSGDVVLLGIAGSVTIRDGSGDITVETAGALTIERDDSGLVTEL